MVEITLCMHIFLPLLHHEKKSKRPISLIIFQMKFIAIAIDELFQCGILSPIFSNSLSVLSALRVFSFSQPTVIRFYDKIWNNSVSILQYYSVWYFWYPLEKKGKLTSEKYWLYRYLRDWICVKHLIHCNKKEILTIKNQQYHSRKYVECHGILYQLL